MCHVSDRIKFCTCAATSVDRLKHYWIHHRVVPGKDVDVLGTMIMPYMEKPEDAAFNRHILLRRINEGDAIDFDFDPKPKDRLQVSINCKNPADKELSGYITYGFEYKNGKWVEKSFNPFDWESRHAEELFGKFKNLFNR